MSTGEESIREEGGTKTASKNPRRGIMGVAAAIIIIALAVVCARFGYVWLVMLFGPPAVSMSEAYANGGEGPRFDHAPFDSILRSHVNDSGGVDYESLMAAPEALRAYTASLAEAPFDSLGRDEKLALLINAYNAFTLELIVEWLDRDIESIRDISSEKRWSDARWNIGGHAWSLFEIENEQIRPKFREPNVHFALVCAAVGCPPLRREAYAAERISEQLEEQARIVHADGSRWLNLDAEAGRLRLTALYLWYRGDFEQISGTALDHAAKYSPGLAGAIRAGSRPGIRWLKYDWSLNNRENLE